MIRCSECEQFYPADSDVAFCIRLFGECVDCKIKSGGMDEVDHLWLEFVSRKGGSDREVKH